MHTTLTMYTVEDIKSRIIKIVETYYNLNNNTVCYYTPSTDEGGVAEPVEMLVEMHPDLEVDAPLTVQQQYFLTLDNPLGPVNGTLDHMKDFLNRSAVITLSFTIDDNVAATQFGPAPMTWRVSLILTNSAGTYIGDLWTTRHITNDSFLHQLGFIPALIITVSVISLGLGIKAIWSTIQVLRRTRKSWRDIPNDVMIQAWREIKPEGVFPVYLWRDIPLAVKIDFFSAWNIIECFGEIFMVIGCTIGFVYDHGLPVSDESRIFIGAGSLIICVNFIKYLEYWKKFSALILTLQGSFLRNLRFIVSVVPIYMGFCVCGFVMFSQYSDYFTSIDVTAVTLFALINGDDTHAIFASLRENYPYPRLAQAYLFSFDLLFITLVLNVFLYIIEDAYQAAAVWINNSEATKLSRSHRRMRADTPMPRGWKPTPGSVEFDVPILFSILEHAQKIMDRLDSTGNYLLNFDFPVDSAGSAFGSMELTPSQRALLPDPDSESSVARRQRRRSFTSEMSESDADDSFNPRVYDRAPPVESQSAYNSKSDIKEDLSTVEGLQTAIENVVASLQIQFQQDVDETIKRMQNDHSRRVQQEVTDILRRSTTALHQRAAQEAEARAKPRE